MMRVDAVLGAFDRAAEQLRFPEPEHPYSYLIAARLHAFSDVERWALVVDTVGYNPRAANVVAVHPSAFHAACPRWGTSGAKSDPGDSYKLADYLRTDGHRLRRLRPVYLGLSELQALTRLRDDQVRSRTAAINQLTALLAAHWPGPIKLFCSLASQIALAFLTAYPPRCVVSSLIRPKRRRTSAVGSEPAQPA